MTSHNRSASNDEMINLIPRKSSIINVEHPEWGSFGVMEDYGDHYIIHSQRGRRTLTKEEAVRFWIIAR